MRIALVSQEYPPTRHGGIGSQTYLKAHGLVSLGHEVYVITHSQDEFDHERCEEGVHVIRIPGFDKCLPIHTEPTRWLTYSCQVAAAVARLQARVSLNIVDFPEWGGEGYVHLLNRTESNYLPVVVHLHGPLVMFAHELDWPSRESEFFRMGCMMESTCLRLADGIFSSSQCSIDWCAGHYGVAGGHIPVLHTGVDIRLFRPLNSSSAKRPTIVFVGKVVHNKGVESLVDAVIELRQSIPEVLLRIIGGGEAGLVAQLKKRIEHADAADIVEFCGFVPRQELPRELGGAHVFAAPSVYEGGPGFVYLEAMACGVPVVACQGSGAAECVRHGQNGLLVPPDDTGELVSVLHRLLSNTDERADMGRRARQYVLEHADSDHCIAEIERFYTQVAEQAPGGGVPA